MLRMCGWSYLTFSSVLLRRTVAVKELCFEKANHRAVEAARTEGTRFSCIAFSLMTGS